MPELPEVETTLRGIRAAVLGRRIEALLVRDGRLRWPVPGDLPARLDGFEVESLRRRAKYLLFGVQGGHLLVHLGMSGSLRVLAADTPPQKHDHWDLLMRGGACLRYRDPRRFGALLWLEGDPFSHPLLRALGPEPLSEEFDGDRLYRLAQGRAAPVKSLLMDARAVVGVGNIYASEALFRAGIHPQRAAGRVALARYRQLAEAVREVLGSAIEQGGTTLRDFSSASGQPGYFAQRLQVYGRDGEPCPQCGGLIRMRRIAQRSSFFCPQCQR